MFNRGSLILFLVFLFACKEPFISPEVSSTPSYLVVDGYLQTLGQATIRLSRTRSLNDSASSSPELNAQLDLLIDNTTDVSFTEVGNGQYSLSTALLDDNHFYQLHIRTTNGKEYVSDSLFAKPSPAIDSVNWTLDPTGLNVFVNTHDQTANTRYYRWEYQETWEHFAHDHSLLIYKGGTVVPRTAAEEIFECWKSDTLTDILIGSTEKLNTDVVYMQPVKFIPVTADEVSKLYSIIVYQYAISKEAYQYWDNLKKNTELRGSLFDPQPSQVSGNIHCISNPEEPVLGFVSAGSVTSQRIFINHDDLSYWYYTYPYECNTIVIGFGDVPRYFADTLLTTPLYSELTGIRGVAVECADCRYGGGSNTKPSFFP